MERPMLDNLLDNSLVALGDTVLMSIIVEPAARFWAIPLGPSITSSTSGVSETIVITISESLASSGIDFAILMPNSFKGLAFSAVRL